MGGSSTQRCTVYKHRNLLAHAPQRLHEEVSADYNDMIYATSAAEIEVRRRAFIRKWRLIAGDGTRNGLSGRVEDWRASWPRYPDRATFPAPSTSQRSMRISRTARPHLLHFRAYGTYHTGATFGPSCRTR